jgi:hypothetical protein
MRTIARVALATGALLFLCRAQAASLTPVELERVVFQSMMMSPDAERARLGMRMFFLQFPNDAAACDFVAERLLKAPEPKDGVAADAIAWHVRNLSQSCSPRYHDTLVLAQKRFTHNKILEHLEVALAKPADGSVAQYAEGGVDLLARQLEVEQQMVEIQRSGKRNVRAVATGMPLGEVLELAGLPTDFSSLTLRVARWGHSTVLAAHYGGSGMLIFRRDFARNRLVLADTFDEQYPVSETYRGSNFGTAQSIACLRALPFRDFVKGNNREIRADTQLLWALANRMSATPFPADDFEEDGMLVSLAWIYVSRNPESLAMLRKVAESPGDKVPKVAREYADKLAAQRAASPGAAAR